MIRTLLSRAPSLFFSIFLWILYTIDIVSISMIQTTPYYSIHRSTYSRTGDEATFIEPACRRGSRRTREKARSTRQGFYWPKTKQQSLELVNKRLVFGVSIEKRTIRNWFNFNWFRISFLENEKSKNQRNWDNLETSDRKHGRKSVRPYIHAHPLLLLLSTTTTSSSCIVGGG